MKVGRNDPCPCGSGKKYKRCCRDKDIGWLTPEERAEKQRLHREEHERHREAVRRGEEPDHEKAAMMTVAMIRSLVPGL